MVADNNTFCGVSQDTCPTFRSVHLGDALPENLEMHAAVGVDSVAMEMGRRFKAARKAKGWTQRDLALATGWSDDSDDTENAGLRPTRLSNFEQGLRRVGIEEAKIFERIFGQPAAYFLGIIDAAEADVIAAMRRNRN